MNINEFFKTALDKDKDEQEKFAKKILDKIGINENPKYLGEGANGSSFSINDKVIKITKDKGEVVNALKTKQKKADHFIDYYDIYKLELNDEIDNEKLKKISKRGLFVLIMEKIDLINSDSLISDLIFSFKCPNENGKLMNRFAYHKTENFEDPETGEKGKWDFEKFKELNIPKKVAERKNLDPNNEEFKKYYNEFFEIMKEAMDIRISLVDMNIDNLGFNQYGTLVAYDLGGLGSSDKSEKKELLSNLKEIKIEDEKVFENFIDLDYSSKRIKKFKNFI